MGVEAHTVPPLPQRLLCLGLGGPRVRRVGHPPWRCAAHTAGPRACLQGLVRACRVRSLTLLSLPSGGNALLVSLVCRSVLHHFHFKGAVHSVSFSPDGRYASAGGVGAVELHYSCGGLGLPTIPAADGP